MALFLALRGGPWFITITGFNCGKPTWLTIYWKSKHQRIARPFLSNAYGDSNRPLRSVIQLVKKLDCFFQSRIGDYNSSR